MFKVKIYTNIRRYGQVVRQWIANPLSPVRIWVPPLGIHSTFITPRGLAARQTRALEAACGWKRTETQRLIAVQIHQRTTASNIQGSRARNTSSAKISSPPEMANRRVSALDCSVMKRQRGSRGMAWMECSRRQASVSVIGNTTTVITRS